MRTLTKVVGLGCLLLTTLFADNWDKKTVLNLNEELLIPGKTLAPGRYVLKLIDSQSNRHIVCVMNEREDQVNPRYSELATEADGRHAVYVLGDSCWEPAGSPCVVLSR